MLEDTGTFYVDIPCTRHLILNCSQEDGRCAIYTDRSSHGEPFETDTP